VRKFLDTALLTNGILRLTKRDRPFAAAKQPQNGNENNADLGSGAVESCATPKQKQHVTKRYGRKSPFGTQREFSEPPSPELTSGNANARNAVRPMRRDENLDVARTSYDQEGLEPKGSADNSDPAPHLSVVCRLAARPDRQRRYRGHYRPHGSKLISVQQATNIIEAVEFSKSLDLPLVAHLTVHWSGTIAFDDHDGTRFAKLREGLAKVLLRRGITPAWVWCRECKAHTDIVHSHLLFHLPVKYRSGPRLAEIENHLERLVDRHGEGILGQFAVRLVIWRDPDGLYLIKGGCPKVWAKFPRIRRDWRTPQGIIHGKRCGTTQNIGPAARLRAMAQTEAA